MLGEIPKSSLASTRFNPPISLSGSTPMSSAVCPRLALDDSVPTLTIIAILSSPCFGAYPKIPHESPNMGLKYDAEVGLSQQVAGLSLAAPRRNRVLHSEGANWGLARSPELASVLAPSSELVGFRLLG